MKAKEIKRTSEKKGISLIVLVITIIVIIILAVAVILSIANNNPIENAKEARFKSDIKTIEEDLNMYTLKKYADGDIKGIEEVNLEGETMVSALPSTKNYKDKVKVKNGTLYIISGELTSSASDEEKKWAKDLGVAEEKILKVGDYFEYEGEPFYIIGGDEVGKELTDATQDILLLAKYNLKEENGKLIQDTNGEINKCAFSSAAYWSSVSGITYPADLNDVNKYPIGSATSIITKAQKYGRDLVGVPGILMTFEEARRLQLKYSGILYGENIEKGFLNYWLGTAEDEYALSHVSGELRGLFADMYDGTGNNAGLRPVIKLSKSLIN